VVDVEEVKTVEAEEDEEEDPEVDAVMLNVPD